MGMKWTEEQKKAISLRDRNILVSAAAGSGKTAVLVQRILNKIMDPDRPVDIDSLLVMTFTRAAAGEMKERIRKALEEAIHQNPDNEHLQRQLTLIHTAQITTIDGFCAWLLRNYFHLIQLDPGYRIAEEGELRLMQEDVLKEVMEEFYEKKEEDFLEFVECYSPGKTDESLKDMIMKLYHTAMSHPYPIEWMESCKEAYEIFSIEEMNSRDWMEKLWDSVELYLLEAEVQLYKGIQACQSPRGPQKYEETLEKDVLLLRELRETVEKREFNRMHLLLNERKFSAFTREKIIGDVDEDLINYVKKVRDQEKALIKEMKEKYFQYDQETVLEMMIRSQKQVQVLIRLTKEFTRRFSEKKREKNVIDFTDMEHFALDILIRKEGDEMIPTQAAWELSEKFDEIIVDEYQDSNYVQEQIMNAVSGWAKKRNNIFMVGDVKQSIYRFRLARPELFMEKYKNYSTEDSREQRIDLHKNFRSRASILESVNRIFEQIMDADLGGITYDKDAALYPGLEDGERKECKTEIILVEKKDLAESELEDAKEMEALAVALKIKEMVSSDKIYDKKTGVLRPIVYGDIAILFRTGSGWAETFGEVLTSQGIPSYYAAKTGYFSTSEVVLLLNYLRICDNPRQDIPLASVLRSPIVQCTSQELGLLRMKHPEGTLADCLERFMEDGMSESEEEICLYEKLQKFRNQLTEFRDMAEYTPVHQLIVSILDRTGYGTYAEALPDGAQRSANLSMLVEKAIDYEKTSYRGLFNFIRYIEKLQKFQIDYGEVNISGAGDGAVNLLTIHKSKGLEFPVVIVAGMGKKFNFTDVNASLVIHPEMGIGIENIFPEKRLSTSSLYKRMIQRTILTESLGEELRVLYVALTRAEERLILTGTAREASQLINMLIASSGLEKTGISLYQLQSAKCYWDYILPAIVNCEDAGNYFSVEVKEVWDLIASEIEEQTDLEARKEYLENWDPEKIMDGQLREELETRFSYSYPWGYLQEIPVKVSVSEMKKRGYHDHSEQEENIMTEAETKPPVPRFIHQEEEYQGAARGTAYHRLMECLDYRCVESLESIKKQLCQLQREKKLNGEEVKCIRITDVLQFVESPLGQRMKKAYLENRLFREQPFVISKDAGELNPDWKGEKVLVQGIIDAFFLEEDRIILVDYKTDRALSGGEQGLIDRYGDQLRNYGQALEMTTGKKVSEIFIYSFTLQKEISLK